MAKPRYTLLQRKRLVSTAGGSGSMSECMTPHGGVRPLEALFVGERQFYHVGWRERADG